MRFYLPILAVILAIPQLAYGGAWTQEQGHGIVIMGGSYYLADQLWDNSGHKRSQPDYEKYELSPYLEYGLSDAITLGANLSFQRLHQDAGPGSARHNHWGMGDSEFFARARLWQYRGFVLSAEPMVKLPSLESTDHALLAGSSHPDAGMGMSLGYGFNAWGHAHFADIDTQYRYRFGNPKDQVRAAATLGIGITDRWIIMPQAFFTYRTESPQVAVFTQSSGDDYDLVKLQLTALYKLEKDVSVQFGGFSNVAGKNVGGGDGAIFSLWKTF